jgi:excisionase family DNA binding protein
MARDYLTCEEAGALLGRSAATVRRWAADPDHPLQAQRFGPQHLLVRRTDVQALLDAQLTDLRGRADKAAAS